MLDANHRAYNHVDYPKNSSMLSAFCRVPTYIFHHHRKDGHVTVEIVESEIHSAKDLNKLWDTESWPG
jgi:hypothetical protein